MGWIVLSLLIITGLSSVIGRASFLNHAIAIAPVDPILEFGAFDSRYYTNLAATDVQPNPMLCFKYTLRH